MGYRNIKKQKNLFFFFKLRILIFQCPGTTHITNFTRMPLLHHRGQVLGKKLSNEVFSGAATNHCPHLPPGEVPEGAVDVIWVKRLKDIGHWGSQCGSWSRRCLWSWSARRRSLGQRVGSRGRCRWGQARQRRTHIHEGTTLEVLLAGVFWTWSFNDETYWS